MKRLSSLPARKVIVGLLLTVLALLALARPQSPDMLLVAKGGLAFEDWIVPESAAIETQARNIALANEQIQAMLSDDYGFLYAVPLGEGEIEAWQERGCRAGDCVQATFYDYQSGGTVEAILGLEAEAVIAGWIDYNALPGASRHILPRAWAVAAKDEDVAAVIANVRTAEPVMIPMSTWMLEGACQNSWCVDLTFIAPDESGRVYHVLIDMEAQEVVETFYTRGLAERSYLRPAAQDISYNNGCRDQYGWSVCWEMTAHDGINFYDAEFIGRTVFSSAKISQVEVFYPAWPGGYRDEIGYGSTVPPYFGTDVRDLGNGFEVRQLYTEFLRWPNCICCYRYEQIIRFYADGSFEPHFISHGPGCDDDSIYRPFWRIDMDLTGPEGDEVWYWNENRWQEGVTETDLELFDNLSQDGYRLFTAGGGLQYYWQPVETDPRGLDAGRLFLLRFRDEEGVGPIAPGPADTFYPPRLWMDGEGISAGNGVASGNYVIWYIPILDTNWEEPYWCVPDPDPEFSPCEALLRIVPGGALVVEPEVAAMPTAESTPTTAPEPASPTATPRPVAGEDATSILLNAGCGACHRLDSLELDGEIGPDLSKAAEWAEERITGLTAAEYLHQSIVQPRAFIAPHCPGGPCQAGIMPANYGQRLTAEQLDTIVEFLLNQEVTVESNPNPTLPPAIGQGNPPDNAPGDIEAQSPDNNNAGPIIIPLITFIIIFGLAALSIWRRRGEQ